MPKAKLSPITIQKIINLRQKGLSLPEIKAVTGHSNGTISKYIKGVKILPEYLAAWKEKQGGSKNRSLKKWAEIEKKANILISLPLSDREKLIILASLYWGEGNKKDLILTNTDPSLIKTFVNCLFVIGVPKEDLKVSIRIFEDIDKKQAISYWAKIVGIKDEKITSVDVLKGKKQGKLKFGMCRVRVRKSGDYFKLIMCTISLIKTDFAAVVQRIERGTPKP